MGITIGGTVTDILGAAVVAVAVVDVGISGKVEASTFMCSPENCMGADADADADTICWGC